MKRRKIVIYQFSFSNGMTYVGQTLYSDARHWQHLKALRRGTHTNPRFQACFSKYGEADLTFEILQVLGPDEYSVSYLTQLECSAFDALNPSVRLNANRPGDAYIPGPTGRAANSARAIARRDDPEFRAKHSEGMKARFEDQEFRAKHAERMKVRFATPEARARHAVARSKYWYSIDDVTFSVASALAVNVGVPIQQIVTAAIAGCRCRGHVIFRLPKDQIDPETGRRPLG